MGCDIHIIAEKKSKWSDTNNKWEPILDPLFENKYYDPSHPVGAWNLKYTFQPYTTRNYEVFSVLSNTRNGRDIKPIDEPRGYPDDMHPVSKYLLDGYDFADHSFTWLSLEEVLAYDWSLPSIYPDCKSLADSGAELLESLDILKKYAEDENCEIRLVFGYDN